MRFLNLVIISFIFSNTSAAQTMKLFDLVTHKEDSLFIEYGLIVDFDLKFNGGRDKRIEMVKKQLNETSMLKSENIISIKEFLDKKNRRFRYNILIQKH